MVASMPSTAACRDRSASYSSRHSNMSKFDADGRRQLLGLAEAIRKHAHQSTSPTSEFKYGRKYRQTQDGLDVSRTTAKTAPTIEDRLMSLLNSDTEGGGDGQSSSNTTTKRTFDRPPTFELASKGCHGSYSPRLAESKMRGVERLNRTTGDVASSSSVEVHHHHQQPISRTRSLSTDRVLEEQCKMAATRVVSNSPCTRRTNTAGISERQRRCVSAIPSSFYDENWNVVPESPKREDSDGQAHRANSPACSSPVGRRTPSGAFNQAIWDQRPPPSPNRASTLPTKSPARPNNNENQVASGTRVAIRNQNGPRTQDTSSAARRTLEYTPSSVPLPAGHKSSSTNTRPILRTRKTPQVPPLPLNRDSTTESGSVVTSPVKLNHTKTAHSVERKLRPIQYTEPPSPAYIRSPVKKALEGTGKNDLKVSSVSSMSSLSSLPVPAKRAGNRQREVKSPLAKERLPSSDTSTKHFNESRLDDDPESCKSDDRDSGAILDAEASVFDFDSSVMSDYDDEVSQNTLKHQNNQTATLQHEKTPIWSRSSTPTLPPLSPFESDDETPRTSVAQNAANGKSEIPILSPVRNEVARLPSYEALLKRKQSEAKMDKHTENNGKFGVENHDHHELSPTESALAESFEKKKAPIETKNTDMKVAIKNEARNQRHRHNSRTSSCDERRVVNHGRHRVGKRGDRHKHGQKRHTRNSEEYTYYDIEDKATSKQKLGRYPVFYRPVEEVPGGNRDAEETSSVRSFTSASVTSSILRRHGRRHKRHHGRNGVLDKAYAKEVRAVNKRFSRLEAHVVTLARSVAQLSSEMRHQSDVSRDIEDLRNQLEELRRERATSSRKSSSSSHTKSDSSKKNMNTRTHPKRVSKLTKFFGEKPPILSLFLAQMGYEKYIENFNSESIGMVELPYMDEERLKSIGIPLGPRIRILNEAKKTCLV